jgi:hypothetical protein
MNYDIPVAIKSENLPRPLTSKLPGKLFVAGRQHVFQCVVSDLKFVCL